VIPELMSGLELAPAPHTADGLERTERGNLVLNSQKGGALCCLPFEACFLFGRADLLAPDTHTNLRAKAESDPDLTEFLGQV
jgi:hypothetical protein